MESSKTHKKQICSEIIIRLMKIPVPTKKDLNKIKIDVSREFRTQTPRNSEILKALKPKEREKLLKILKLKPVRTVSGVVVIAVMAEPYPCPHGTCAYCPGGPPYNTPQSYTGHEPAAMRGIQCGFDPHRQVRNRIEQMKAIGHTVDKAELIIMGGTFPSTPLGYQKRFVQRCLDAINVKESKSLTEAKKNAEKCQIHNVGITIETRPDFAKEKQADQMLSMGVTRVELGVQNVYDDIYELVNRGHRVQDVVEATRTLKDAGLKVAYHIMPGLPGSNHERDFNGFQKVFTHPNFKPDMIKIYPCLVIEGTEVHEWWKKGEYKPYSTEEAAQLILEMKKRIPPWIRIMRVQRDIPAQLIVAGVNQSNLRQLVLKRLNKLRIRCRCIRCREVGHRFLMDGIKPRPDNIQVSTIKEEASEGEEIFISAEDSINDVLIGYLRLRIPSKKAHRREIIPNATAIIRELHVYGQLVPVGNSSADAWQHKGYGKILLSEAERISREDYDLRKVIVTSALGTKKYYMRLGYVHNGPYVSKILEG
jgi:elongator complex protein 3